MPAKQATADFTGSFDAIVADFEAKRIPITAPAFYDHPNFLAIEQSNPHYLANYAKFVQNRPFDDAYAEHVRRVVPVVVKALHDDLVARGTVGDCIWTSMGLSRILEEQGIWNYIIKGSLTISVQPPPKLEPVYFYAVDPTKTLMAAHAWVVAPPFIVIDPTVKQQDYAYPNAKKVRESVPEWVAAEKGKLSDLHERDIFSPDARLMATSDGITTGTLIRRLLPQFIPFSSQFPPRIISIKKARLKYIPLAASAAQEPLTELKTVNGKPGDYLDLYQQSILPALGGEMPSQDPQS